uniref:Uncharacterized protein n=1 Tax=Lepeophtheirus salmonis TaxID=72036 RepID=A0A0K2TRS0_LEPSM
MINFGLLLDPKVRPINRTKQAAGVMMLDVVASDGKAMPLFWVPKDIKINTKEYLKVMNEVVKSWLDQTYPQGGYVGQQDLAPAHQNAKTQKWYEMNLDDFWTWSMWPPFFRDCSPLDYCI